MADDPDMITAIEQAALLRLTDKIPVLKSAAVQKDTRQMLRDVACAVAVLEGTFSKVGQSCFRNSCTVSVLLKFKNMQSEEARRAGINPLVLAATQTLLGQKLGLAIGALAPVRFSDVTTEEKYAAGVIEYLLEFSTWFDVLKLGEEQTDDLITIAVNYFLIPGDDIADAADIIRTNP